MIHVSQRAQVGQQQAQEALSLGERERAQVPVLESEQIEAEQGGGQLLHRALEVARRGEQRALLQPLEARAAGVVEHHDLAVEHDLVDRERAQGGGKIGVHPRRIGPAAVVDHRAPLLAPGDGPEPVVFQLEDPARIAERPRLHLGEHRLHLGGADRSASGPDCAQLCPNRLGARRRGQDRRIREGAPPAHVRVARLLDEEPFLAAGPHQRPRAPQLVPVQLEEELPLAQAGRKILHGRAAAAIPGVAVRPAARLDLDGKAPLRRVGRRPLGNGPGPQNAVRFQVQRVSGARACLPHDGEPPARPLVQEVGHEHEHVIIARMAARSIGSGTISFGLVSIPVKLFSATQSQAAISFNLLHSKCKGRLKQQYICPRDENQIVERNDMVKGYEFSKDQYVTFTPEELKALEEKASQQIEISEFVPTEKIDPVFFDKAYYLGPEKGADRAYRLLSEAMRATGRTALARYAARGKQYLVQLRPIEGGGLVMQQLMYSDEVRPFSEVELPQGEVKPAELELAKQIIEQIAENDFKPEKYEDDVKKRIQEQIQRKVEGQEIDLTPAEQPKTQVIDLMEALKASLAARGEKASEPVGEDRKPARRAPRAEKAAKASRK